MDALWIMWVVISIGSFATLETIGLLSSAQGDTLSERLRAWGKVHTRTSKWLYVILASLTVTFVWLPGHILGWWP